MNSRKATISALVALALTAVANAGGPALLQLPVEGVTSKNSDQCEKLLEEKLGPVLSNWNNPARGGDVRMIVEKPTNLVQLRPGRSQLSLGEIEKALKGSPFSINREQLVYVGVVQFEIGKMEDHEKLVSKLGELDGVKMGVSAEKNKDGTILITLSDPQHRAGVIVTHKRLAGFLAENNLELNAVSWSGRFHCRAPFGARTKASKVAGR